MTVTASLGSLSVEMLNALYRVYRKILPVFVRCRFSSKDELAVIQLESAGGFVSTSPTDPAAIAVSFA